MQRKIRNSSSFDYLLGAFDGTGSADWRNSDGSNSFVYQFYKRFGAPSQSKHYYDGPDTPGIRTPKIAKKGLADLVRVLAKKAAMQDGPKLNEFKAGYASLPMDASGNVRVCLVGHSRGGLIAIWIANELSRHGIPVYFLGLYDSVDRAHSLDPFHPPEGSQYALEIDSNTLSNVTHTFHALRDPELRSRVSFGNSTRADHILDSHQHYTEEVFKTSHGGIGGDPAPKAEVIYGKYGQPIKNYGVFSDRTCTEERGQERVDLCNQQSVQANQWIIRKAQSLGVPV